MPADPKQTHVARTWKHTSPLISCRFDVAGKHVFATAEDMTVLRWELATGKKVAYPAVHDSWVRGLAFTRDGGSLITGGFDGRIMWWPSTGDKPQPTRKIDAHDGWVRSLDVSPDGKLLASCGNDKLVKLWDVATGKPLAQFAGHDSHVYSVRFHPDGKLLLSGDLSGSIRQWDLATSKQVRALDAKSLHTYNGGQQVHYGGVRSIDISPDKKHLIASGLYKASNPLGAVNEPLLLRFDWSNGKLLHSHITTGVRGIAWRAKFLADGTLIGCSGGSGGGWLLFFNAKDAKAFHKVKLPNTARDMDVHPDGIQVATAHYDRQLRISRMAKKVPQTKKK